MASPRMHTAEFTIRQPNEASNAAATPTEPLPPDRADQEQQSPALDSDALSRLLFQAYCQGLQSAGQPGGAEVDIVALLAKEEAIDQGDAVLAEKMRSWYRTGFSMAQR